EKRACKFRPGIAAVGEDLFQPRIFPQRLRSDQRHSRDPGHWPELSRAREGDLPYRRGVALNTFNFLARIIADRINGDPPFSVALATCVSMIAAVGSPSRPQAFRHLCSRV